ncbi:MAG: hypothetical protein EBQ96_04455 [Proteobacteria bacterium]|nr:hypothetical protein [Pseudomonadota bacterium]
MKINTRSLFISLISTAVLAAVVGIVQVWLSPFSWDVFLKILATLTIIGVVSSFLLAVDYDLGSTSSRGYLYGLVGLAIASGALVIAQIWLDMLPWAVFINLVWTLLIITGLLGFVLVAKDDFTKNKKLRDENYID